MMRKLVPVAGNVCESNLGMDPHTANEIANEVDVIINSAANTTFDERFLFLSISLQTCIYKITLYKALFILYSAV